MSGNQNKLFLLILISLSSLTTPFMGSSINLALPAIGAEFGLSAIYISWIATTFILSTAALLLPMGRLADMYGRTRLYTYGMILYSVSSIACGLAFSGEMLLVLRVIQGMGASMLFSTSTAILVAAFPANQRGRVLGFNVAAVYIGLSLGPFFGGMITQHFGWRYIFFLNGLIGLFVIALVPFLLNKEVVESKGEKFDLVGSVLYGISLICLMYGFSILPGMTGVYLVVIGVLGLLLFARYELKEENPVLNIHLLRSNKTFAYSNLAALINYSATTAVSFLLSFYLQYIKGLKPQGAGIILVAQPIMMAIFSPISGKISDRKEPQVVASLGMTITTIGLVILIFLTPETSYLFIITSLVLLGFGFALFSSPNTNAVMSSVEKKHLGIASSTVSTMRLTGQMLSMGIAMLIFSVIIGQVKIGPANHEGLLKSIKIAFSIFSLFCFGGIFASLSRGKMRQT